MAKGVVALDQMKLLTPFMTAGGDVYRVGYFDGGNASARAEVVWDAAADATPHDAPNGVATEGILSLLA